MRSSQRLLLVISSLLWIRMIFFYIQNSLSYFLLRFRAVIFTDDGNAGNILILPQEVMQRFLFFAERIIFLVEPRWFELAANQIEAGGYATNN